MKCVALVTLSLFALTLFSDVCRTKASVPARPLRLPASSVTAKPSKPITPARAQKAARFSAESCLRRSLAHWSE